MVYFFDNSATTMPYQEVLQAYMTVATQFFANPSSIHLLGVESKRLLEQARENIAQLLHVQAGEVFFTSSGTEANNWLFQSIIERLSLVRPNARTILLLPIEHPSITEQIKLLEAKEFDIQWLEIDQNGVIDIEKLAQQLNNDVLFISTMAVNNEVGTVQPLDAIAHVLLQYPQIIWHVDAVQAITTQLDIIKLSRIDALTLSGHKFHAGRGTGVLILKSRINNQPLLYGGGQEKGYRSGTENLASIVATAKALRLAYDNQLEVKNKLKQYRTKIIKVLEKHQWEIFARQEASEHIICAAFPGIPGEVLVHAFEAVEVILSTTSACSSRKHQAHHTLQAMGISENVSKSAIRISMSADTTEADVEGLMTAIIQVTKQFQ